MPALFPNPTTHIIDEQCNRIRQDHIIAQQQVECFRICTKGLGLLPTALGILLP